MRYEFKRLIVYGMYLFVWPFGLSSALLYSLYGNESVFDFFAKLLSLLPGKPGQYLRTAFYKMTLEECHYDLMVGFGSFFAHPTARVGRQVGIGSYSIVGTADIGDNVMIASRVSILSGKYTHGASGEQVLPVYTRVHIGAGSWLGEGSVVMTDIGKRCVISAGSVVTKPMPDRCRAIGNPARFMQDEHFANNSEPRAHV